MIDRPELYFEIPDHPTWALTRDLVLSKPAADQPASVENAERLMRAAATGEIGRRSPLLAVREGDRFRIVDGNATAAVALRHGWERVPIVLEANDPHAQ